MTALTDIEIFSSNGNLMLAHDDFGEHATQVLEEYRLAAESLGDTEADDLLAYAQATFQEDGTGFIKRKKYTHPMVWVIVGALGYQVIQFCAIELVARVRPSRPGRKERTELLKG